MGVAAAEDTAGDQQHIPLDGPLHELRGVAGDLRRDLDERVERPPGVRHIGHRPQDALDQVPLGLVGGDVGADVQAQGHGEASLGHRGGADERVLLKLGHLLDDRQRAGRVAHAPARAAVGLAEAPHQAHLLREPGGAGAAAGLQGIGVRELVVDLVGDDHHAPGLAQIHEVAQLPPAQDHAAGVAGGIDQQQLRARRDERLHALGRHAEVGGRVAENDLRPGHTAQRRIDDEERVGDDHLIPGIQRGQECQQQGAARARAHHQAKIV